MDRIALGKKGEQVAADFLKQKGFTIVETNFRKRLGEIDIIALTPDGEYVFAEVKTRSGDAFGFPEEAVDARKVKKIWHTAQAWLTLKKIKTDRYRIDVLAITYCGEKPQVVHLENIA